MRSTLNADVICWSGGRWMETGGYISSVDLVLWPLTHSTASKSVPFSSSTDRVAYLRSVRTALSANHLSQSQPQTQAGAQVCELTLTCTTGSCVAHRASVRSCQEAR